MTSTAAAPQRLAGRRPSYDGTDFAPSWGSIGLVEADFTHTCWYTGPVRGHVRTWETVGEGFLPCSEPSDDVAGHTAALLLCPAGSRAAEPA